MSETETDYGARLDKHVGVLERLARRVGELRSRVEALEQATETTAPATDLTEREQAPTLTRRVLVKRTAKDGWQVSEISVTVTGEPVDADGTVDLCDATTIEEAIRITHMQAMDGIAAISSDDPD